jgi:hypothetical protein
MLDGVALVKQNLGMDELHVAQVRPQELEVPFAEGLQKFVGRG